MPEVKKEEYKGHPLIAIPVGEKKDGSPYYFSFGVRKAQAIVKYFDDIVQFVAENDEE